MRFLIATLAVLVAAPPVRRAAGGHALGRRAPVRRGRRAGGGPDRRAGGGRHGQPRGQRPDHPDSGRPDRGGRSRCRGRRPRRRPRPGARRPYGGPRLRRLHDHTFYMTRGRRVQLNFSAPRLYLASGVTTIRTTGAFSPYSELNLKRSIQEGQRDRPADVHHRAVPVGRRRHVADVPGQHAGGCPPRRRLLGRRGGRLVQGLYPDRRRRAGRPPSTRRTGAACGSPATCAPSRSGRRWPWASTTSSTASSPTATTWPASSPASARPTCGGASWRSTSKARRWRPPSGRWSSRASP